RTPTTSCPPGDRTPARSATEGPRLSTIITTQIRAQEASGTDGAIQSVFGPFVDSLAAVVFFSVPVFGADLPLAVVWLVAGGIFCNVYLRVRPIKDAKQAIRVVR